MKKLYEKNELTFALVWIAVYCVLQSLANPLNKVLGIEYAASAVFCILQAIVLFAFIRKTTCKSGMGFANPPSLPVDFFTMCRLLSWRRGTSGTASPSIIR